MYLVCQTARNAITARFYIMDAMRSITILLALVSMAAAQAPVPAFKESGTVMAPITVEVYTDYQCPHCRAFYLETLPLLTSEFVKTGKVRLIHRDFPLQQFQYSKTAMHYANAAGQVGKFDAVALQLFETQPEWSQNGNVEAAVAKVLTPAEMEKVRMVVKNDSHLDDSVTRDVAMATSDHLTATPTIVIVFKGKRETISGGPAWPVLRSYLTSKLGE
jgi:protein-disulfide isomerase